MRVYERLRLLGSRFTNLCTLYENRLRRLSKECAWIVLGQAAAAVGALIGVRLITELLDPTAYGELALAMTMAALINQTVLGPLGGGIVRFYAPAQEHGDLDGYLRAVRRLLLSATWAIVVLNLVLVVGLLLGGHPEWIKIATAAILFAIFSGYNSILSGIQNAARQRAASAFYQGAEPWVRVSVAAGLLVWLGASSTVAMVGYAIAVMLVLGSQYAHFRKSVTQNPATDGKELDWRERIWEYSWPISTFGIFTWMQQASDRWALEMFATTREVGLYGVLCQLAQYPIMIVTGIAVQLLAPILYQRVGDARDGERNASARSLNWRLTWAIIGLTGGGFALALIFHARIFRVLLAEEYSSKSYLLPWMILAAGIFAAGQSVALNLMCLMKTRAIMTAKIVTALLGTALNIAGAYWYSTTGVVIASILFSMLFFAWMAVLSKVKD